MLQVDAHIVKSLRPVALGKSKLSKVGQWVLAVGNPYGFDRTVSFGIISAKGRNVPQAPVLNDFIQTDAFIAPGSSGGPLLNMHGEVIGINSRGGSGLAFTIPIETALEVKDKLLKSGGIKRGWLGVHLQPLDIEMRKRLGISDAQGVMISQILRSSNFYGKLQPLDIVVVNTRAGSRYGNPDYVAAGAGMGYEATMYLLERGVRLTGTDAWSWDAPFSYTAKKVAETGNTALIWEGHKAGRDIGYCHLEKLHNLEALPPTGFIISCFPHKIRGASAGWTRAVAIFDEALMASV